MPPTERLFVAGFRPSHQDIYAASDQKRKLIYCPARVTNDRCNPAKTFTSECLLDSGASQEMILPLAESEQLGLEQKGAYATRGFGSNAAPVAMRRYRAAKVELLYHDQKERELMPYKDADLEVSAQADGGATAQLELVSPHSRPMLEVADDGNQVLKFSPIKRPEAGLPAAIIGAPGLARLNLIVDYENAVVHTTAHVEITV